MYCTIVYAKNTSAETSALQRALVNLGNSIQEAQILSGDFNSVLSTEDILGSPVTPGETQELRDFLDTL